MEVDRKFKMALQESLEGIDYENCLLFGSRARGTAQDDSDYDILIILKQPCSQHEKYAIANRIRSHLARYLIPADVLVKTKEDIELYGWLPGGTIRHALRDGVAV
ncbi:MAG: nucleotidyltransferase domain-containing protein [Chitinivibrionales bacterium]|nr:nucleotidyltransferase domain-containing protein [Chitinivibrionales bacterium]